MKIFIVFTPVCASHTIPLLSLQFQMRVLFFLLCTNQYHMETAVPASLSAPHNALLFPGMPVNNSEMLDGARFPENPSRKYVHDASARSRLFGSSGVQQFHSHPSLHTQ